MAGLLSQFVPAAASPLGSAVPPTPVDRVSIELRRWASTPFDWATDNCGLAVLRYAISACGRELVPAPRFADERRAWLMLAGHGGFDKYCIWAMDQLGCLPTDSPVRGDVGLVTLPAGLTAAICCGDGAWAARGDHSVIIERVEPLLAWSVPCPRQ